MQKTKYFTCIYHTVLVFCSKNCQTKKLKINNRRELQNITITHSADINYKDFMKIYREYTKEPYFVLTIDTTLPASDPLRFKKNSFHS